MPWLHVTTTGGPDSQRGLAERLARQVAVVAGLAPDAVGCDVESVIVLRH